MFPKASLLTSIVIAVVVMCSSSLSATTYYVAPSGSDANSCTSTAKCLTITRAYSLAGPGDVVEVAAGTYNEDIHLNRSGSSGLPITIRGHSGGGCPTTSIADVNHPTGKRPNPPVVINGDIYAEANYLKLDCLKTTNGGSFLAADVNVHHIEARWMVAQGVNGSIGVPLCSQGNCNANDVYISDCYVTRFGFGIIVHGSRVTVERCEVFDMRAGAWGEDGDYSRVFGDSITFRRNYFHGNDINNCPGCHIDGWQHFNVGCSANDYLTNLTLDGNVVFNTHEGIILTNTCGPTNMTGLKVINNLIAYGPNDSHPWCMLFDGRGTTVEAYNNTCIGGGAAIRDSWRTGGASMVYRNNIHYSGGSGYVSESGGMISASDRNLRYTQGSTFSGRSGDIVNVNPLFVSESAHNYRLQSASPAKDQAVNTGLQWDLAGAMRPQGTGYDIGAYEFQSTVAGPPAPPTNLQAIVQ